MKVLAWVINWFRRSRPAPEIYGPEKPRDVRSIACDRMREIVASNPASLEFSVRAKEYDRIVGCVSRDCRPSMTTNLWTWHVPDNRRFVLLRKTEDVA